MKDAMTEHEDAALREHAYITTFTGVRFSFLDPKPEQFRIRDIAHSLAFTARFRGHTTRFYSVAEHSLLVAALARENGRSLDVQTAALMHDAHEAYVGDVPSPLKWACPAFAAVEDQVAAALRRALTPDLDELDYALVKRYDTQALHLEAAALFQFCPAWVQSDPTYPVSNLPPEVAEMRFLHCAAELGLV